MRNTQLSDAVARLPGGAAYHFAPDPSSQRASTIGGNASTNAGGIHTLKDFVSSNHVLGLEMVLPDGTVIDVGGEERLLRIRPVRSPRPDLRPRGTFGIITKLWVRLVPKATSFRTLVGIFSTHRRRLQRRQRRHRRRHAAGGDGDARRADGASDRGRLPLRLPADAQALILTEIDGIDALLDGADAG